jgi:GNAT superfamily N-acetyltransferase
MSNRLAIGLQRLTDIDLDAANAVIEAAIMTWTLPQRVKRLSLPSYRYTPHDLAHLRLIGAKDPDGTLVGVAAWEPASPEETPPGTRGLLLHGIYVAPERHGEGIGSRLLDAALRAARETGADGLLVKASPDAQGFFRARGLRRLTRGHPARDYPHRYWMDVADGEG